MKEREINIKRNDDPTLVVDKDGEMAKKLKRIYEDLNLNLGFCHDQLVKGNLSEGMKESHLYLAEHSMIEFLKAFNYDSVLAKKSDERHKDIRALNEENRQLRKQLGQKVSNEDLREKIKNISTSFEKWWNTEGFGHTSEIRFNANGYVEVKLSGRITSGYHSDPKIKAKDKVNILKNKGFEVSGDREILATDNNTRLLINLLQSKYPSSEIIEFNISFWDGKNRYSDIKVLIRDLDDFKE